MVKQSKQLLSLLFFVVLSFSVFAEGTKLEFQKNPKIQEAANAFSLDCVDWTKKTFGIELDWSDASVQHIEGMLNQLSKAVSSNNPPPKERIKDFANLFGFYIGEVYRKNHGGVEWGDVIIDGNKYYGMAKRDTGEPFIWPIVKAHKRIVLGQEENIWHYYQAIIAK